MYLSRSQVIYLVKISFKYNFLKRMAYYLNFKINMDCISYEYVSEDSLDRM